MDDIARILEIASERLATVNGVVGFALGGSRARGTHGQDSDIDIGIYYDAEKLDVEQLSVAFSALDDGKRFDLLAPSGAWGNWVNGGGWLTIGGRPVDLILRDIERVRQSVADGLAGIITPHYQTGHPHTFLNCMYMAELAIGQIMHDPSGTLKDLRALTRPYPEKMKRTLVNLFLFESEFSLMLAGKYIASQDCYYIVAHIVRSVSGLNQVLFAINEEYCINEKKAVPMIDSFAKSPTRYSSRIHELFSLAGNDPQYSCNMLSLLIKETKQMVQNYIS